MGHKGDSKCFFGGQRDDDFREDLLREATDTDLLLR